MTDHLCHRNFVFLIFQAVILQREIFSSSWLGKELLCFEVKLTSFLRAQALPGILKDGPVLSKCLLK